MRVLLVAAALVFSTAGTASAEFFPIKQPGPPPPCLLTPGQPNPPNVQVDCPSYPTVTLTQPSQVRLMVAFKVRAIWGAYAVRHITSYGCRSYELVPGKSTVCAVRFRSRQNHAVTRRIRLAYVRTGERTAGVRVSRVPPYPTPTATAPTVSGPPLTTADPTVTTPGTTITSTG